MGDEFAAQVKRIIDAKLNKTGARCALPDYKAKADRVCALIAEVADKTGAEAVFAEFDSSDLLIGFDCWDVIIEDDKTKPFVALLNEFDEVKFFQIRDDLVRSEFRLKNILTLEDVNE